MAFHGDLFSFPLPELLQWLDASRKTGTIQLVWEAGERRLYLLSGEVVATAAGSLWERIARSLESGNLAVGSTVLAAFRSMGDAGSAEQAFRAQNLDLRLATELAREELYGSIADLIQAQGGQFHWTEDPDRGADEWVPLQLTMRHALFEALRWVDEQPDVERALPQDSMVVHSIAMPEASQPPLTRIILHLASTGRSLGQLRLTLGLSRATVSRHVFDLLRAKKVSVDGAPVPVVDPVAEMLEKGALLVRERQFEAAGLIFETLLSSDPADRRVREFAHVVEREHIATLYRELPPLFVPVLNDDNEALSRLRPEERRVASLANGKWDVSTIVLASHVRELDTLKYLLKLVRMGLVNSP